MTTALADTKVALWGQRKTAMTKRATLALFRGTLCGCTQCGDSDRIEEIDALITRATEAIDELGNRICERTLTCSS